MVNQTSEKGAPYREVFATEAIRDLPLEATEQSQYVGPPTNPFQAKAIIKKYSFWLSFKSIIFADEEGELRFEPPHQ
jgi:hypothetical protein